MLLLTCGAGALAVPGALDRLERTGPVTEEEAVERYRSTAVASHEGTSTSAAVGTSVAGATGAGAAATTTVLAPDRAPPSTATTVAGRHPGPGAWVPPQPGVYRYATTGQESLNGRTHDYPEETPVTISAVECGITQVWTPTEGRSNEQRLCRGPGGEELRSGRQVTSFFGQTSVSEFTCEQGAVYRPRPAPPGKRDPFRCSGEGYEARITTEVIGLEHVQVGDTQVPALHVRHTSVLSGSFDGTETEEWWLDPDTSLGLKGLGAGEVKNGPLTYRERWTLQLLSLTPRT